MKEHGVPDSRLTVIKKDTDNPKPGEYWLCQCECGNFISVKRENLIRKDRKGTRSCGCMHKEVINRFTQLHTHDLTNQRFGKLVALYRTDRIENGETFWMCQCDCGQLKEVKTNNLLQGRTQSCGCLSSVKEEYIAQQLLSAGYDFARQYTFSNCVGLSGRKLRFDFAVFINNKTILIEYQGEQHYNPNNPWYSTDNVMRDNIKRQFCQEHKIQLIELTKEDDLNNLIELIKERGDDLSD